MFAKLRDASSQPSNVVVPNQFEDARARHRDSSKAFACFLSHHKQSCAAEARLVKQQLESMLDAKVFLGMTKYPTFNTTQLDSDPAYSHLLLRRLHTRRL